MDEPDALGIGKIPLTPYDILGYVTPGSTLLACILAFEYCVRDLLLHSIGSTSDIDTPLLSSLRSLYRSGLATDTWMSLALLGIAVLGVAYVLGHVVASLSSFFVDRILVYKGYGYPYEILFGFKDRGNTNSEYSGAFYRGMFFWLNVYLGSAYVLHFLGQFTESHGIRSLVSSTVVLSGFLLVIAVPLKLVVSAADHWASRRSTLPSGSVSRLAPRARSIVAALLKTGKIFLVVGFAGLYDVVAKFLGGILNTRRSFTDEFIGRYKMWFGKCFSIEAERAQTNNFWFAYSYVMRHSGVLTSRLTHWLTLYMFSRNLSTAFYLAFLYCFAWLWLSSPDIYASSDRMAAEILALPLGYLFLAFAMLIRFYYLFLCRFTKVVFKSFVFLNEVERNEQQKARDGRDAA